MRIDAVVLCFVASCPWSHFSHHSCIVSTFIFIWMHSPAQLLTRFHTSLANGHKWKAVSGSWSHNGQMGLQGQFLTRSLSAVVSTFAWTSSHAKNFSFPSACALQIDCLKGTVGAFELCLVIPVRCPLPSNLIFLFIELHLLDQVPKAHELCHVLHSLYPP